MSEARLQADIRIAAGRVPHSRVFRNNRGLFWAGKPVQRDAASVTLLHPRQVECGLADGAGDLIGITQVVITHDMVGKTIDVFTSGEVKQPGVAVPERQDRRRTFVDGFGGRAAIIRSCADGLWLIGGSG